MNSLSLKKRHWTRVMLSLDSELLKKLDAVAKRNGVSRSALVEHAFKQLLDAERKDVKE